MKKNSLLFIILFIGVYSFGYSQSINETKEKSYKVLPYLSYGIDTPLGDLKDRFGYNFGVNGGFDLVFKNNYSTGLFVKYKFGNNIKEDVIAPLRVANNEIIGKAGYANVSMGERAIYTGIQFGKVLDYKIGKKSFALKFDIGTGIMSHYIYIDNTFEDVPQLNGDLSKSFDRLTNGWGIHESISFHYVAPNNWRLFFALEGIQSFTKSARNIQFGIDANQDYLRKDMLIGAHIGFILPFQLGNYGEEIYY